MCGGQPSPHKPRLVVSHSTCPPVSSSPHAHSFVIVPAVINTHTGQACACTNLCMYQYAQWRQGSSAGLRDSSPARQKGVTEHCIDVRMMVVTHQLIEPFDQLIERLLRSLSFFRTDQFPAWTAIRAAANVQIRLRTVARCSPNDRTEFSSLLEGACSSKIVYFQR